MKSRLVATLAVLVFGVFQSPLHADKYDDELRLQRDAKRLQDMWDAEDKRGREAALLRERGGPSSSGPVAEALFVLFRFAVIGGAIFGFYFIASENWKIFSAYRKKLESEHQLAQQFKAIYERDRRTNAAPLEEAERAKVVAAEKRDQKTRQKNQAQLDELKRTEIGQQLAGLIASIAEKSKHSIDDVAKLISSESDVPFVVKNGELHLTLEQARKIEPWLPEIAAQCKAIHNHSDSR